MHKSKELLGLSQADVEKSRALNGTNLLEKEKSKGFFRSFFENLADPIIRVLLIAVLIEVIFTFGNCNWLEVGGIIIAVLVATVVSTASEYGSSRAFERMQRDSLNTKARIRRDGELIEVSEGDIVVGDIVYLAAGEGIPADGVMLSGKISVDQSSINGESKDVSKYLSDGEHKSGLSSHSEVFRGSLVRSGEGIMRVSRVGSETHYGKVAKDVQAQTRESPLKLRLSSLASFISKLGYIMAAIVGLTYLFFAYVVDNNFEWSSILNSFQNIPYVIATLSHALTLMITVIVVAVPEGLPMMITVVLSANMKKMLNDNVMVKKLVGIETAGSMNILFTDKTGTLTEGRPTVDRVITKDGIYKSALALRKSEDIYSKLLISARYAVDSSAGALANSTDRAMSGFFSGEGERHAVVSERLPFSSERKYSSIKLDTGLIISRGAPEIILSKCRYSKNAKGDSIPDNMQNIFSEYHKAALRGERVIAVCESGEGSAGVTFLALVILRDKLRRGVRDAVNQITHAGVQVVMLTGDGKETATTIAEECGIMRYGSEKSVLTREELDAMSDDEVKEILPRLRVVSRALPQDKTRLVRLSQELNLVVGMTGDGINDAPSLKLADVGFAMGSGTEIAKGAGDIVILDNSFDAIVKTVLYGRTIFKSIRKFISFQLMMNLTACGVSLLGQFIGIDNPITIIQMLWINIIMDTLGGLAFSGEPPLDYYMLERPKRREEKILSRDMLHQILFTGAYTLLLCVCFLNFDFFKSLFRPDASDAYFLTGFYALFVFSGIFNCFSARCERMWMFSNIGKNKPFVLIMIFISVIQIVMIYFGGDVFRCAPLTFRELLNVILLAASVIPFDMLRRLFRKMSAAPQSNSQPLLVK